MAFLERGSIFFQKLRDRSRSSRESIKVTLLIALCAPNSTAPYFPSFSSLSLGFIAALVFFIYTFQYLGAVVRALAREKTALRQARVALSTLETPYVEILVLHS